MSLLAETLVEEWLNRRGFFTVRGVKHGVDEIDLLAVRPSPTNGPLEAWHIEVQASFRPMGLIAPLTARIRKETGKPARNAMKRDEAMVRECVEEWVQKKWFSDSKADARNRAWPGLTWQMWLAHAVVKYEPELECIKSHGVGLIPFGDILADLCDPKRKGLTGAVGTDVADIVAYAMKLSSGQSARALSAAPARVPGLRSKASKRQTDIKR